MASKFSRSGDRDTDFLCLFETGSFYDCSIKVEKRRFRCHKIILIMSSPVFERMLCGDFAESTKGADDEIAIDSISADAFDKAMRFLYGNKIYFENSINLTIEIFRFAHKWQISKLFRVASDILQKKLDATNVLQILKMHHSLGVTAGLDKCWKIIQEQTVEVLSSAGWLECSSETVKTILSREKLSVNEIGLFQALLKWGSSFRGKGTTRSKINEFLPLIRFLTMTENDFVAICTATNDELTSDEKLNILLAIKTGKIDFYPTHLSKSRKSRCPVTAMEVSFASITGQIRPRSIHINTPPNTRHTVKLSLRSHLFSVNEIFITGVVMQDLSMFANSHSPTQTYYFAYWCLSNAGSRYNLMQLEDSEDATVQSAEFKFLPAYSSNLERTVRFDPPVKMRVGCQYALDLRAKGYFSSNMHPHFVATCELEIEPRALEQCSNEFLSAKITGMQRENIYHMSSLIIELKSNST
ncbi:kelch-like protein 40b [Neocloeon triangulifer]|uniref:kelch-like protein 40b n=1 Tax=Neocloeon triangulifer TaxID=2078957 RepID=UPI00286F77E4|nr:kelch-like protein 40b [Neocloeon triangulifer]